MCVETVEDTDAQLAIQRATPLAVSLQQNVYECGLFKKSTTTFYNLEITQVKSNAATPVEICMEKLPVKVIFIHLHIIMPSSVIMYLIVRYILT